jgi:hypothetical protein
MADRWTLAAVYRVACLSLTVFRNEQLIATRQHRYDGRPRTPAKFAEDISKLAVAYGIETVVVEPGSAVATGAQRTGRHVIMMTIADAAQMFDVTERRVELCQRIANRHRELQRHIRMLPGDRISTTDRRGQCLILSVALGLAFQKKIDLNKYL